MVDRPKRTETRAQWTIKHSDLGPEFQTLVRMAAERQGQTIGAFVVETVRERATAIMKGEVEGTPTSTPPARLEDVADALAAGMAEAFGALSQQQAERLAALERRQADRLAALERDVRRGRWRR